MPNWCDNNVTISHPDTTKMQALVEAINKGKFCDHVIPMPEDLMITAGRVGEDDDPEQIELVRKTNENVKKYGAGNWYDFCLARWGTKWDVDAHDTVTLDDKSISFGFYSAWAPPIGVYEVLVEQGYEVKANYYEPGVGFAGVWDNGDDDYYELSGMNSAKAREELPEDLDKTMGISESMEMWENE